MEIGKIGSTPPPKGYDSRRKVHPVDPIEKEQAYDPDQDQHRKDSTPKHPYKGRNLDVKV